MEKYIIKNLEKHIFIRGLLNILIIVGMINFSTGFLSALGLLSWLHIEFPHGDICGILTDNRGYIILADSFYGRIQTYDKDGNFLTSWYVGANGGKFEISVDDAGKIHVITSRNNMYYVFNKSGTLINDNKIIGNVSNDFGKIDKDSLDKIKKHFYLIILNPFISILYVIFGSLGLQILQLVISKQKVGNADFK